MGRFLGAAERRLAAMVLGFSYQYGVARTENTQDMCDLDFRSRGCSLDLILIFGGGRLRRLEKSEVVAS